MVYDKMITMKKMAITFGVSASAILSINGIDVSEALLGSIFLAVLVGGDNYLKHEHKVDVFGQLHTAYLDLGKLFKS